MAESYGTNAAHDDNCNTDVLMMASMIRSIEYSDDPDDDSAHKNPACTPNCYVMGCDEAHNESEALKDSNSVTLFLVGLLKSKVVAPKDSLLSTKLSFDYFSWLSMELPSNVPAVKSKFSQ